MTDRVAVESNAVWPDDAMDVEEGAALREIRIETVSVDVPALVASTIVSILVEEREEFERGEALARIRSDT